ncbi:response regulator [Paenibacillus macerans]|uniref:response regulator n=1 Tax=Paenibacillus macerans TaxID=44252 RepID=UPI00203B54C4|nr:response regulator [Paenibacillus macerans]MCM3700822.1 response regulator [Paenibacillus macerans]
MSELRVLLVDDEDFVLEGLRDAVEWGEYGMRVVGFANNGKEALDLLSDSETPIDIIFTDIKMPIMDGFQLTEALKSMNYPSKIVVLTGHEEFEFAKKAISYGIFEYLLKPVELDSIVKVLQRLTDMISKERERINETIRVENKLKESLPLLQERLLFSMLSGDYEPELMEFIGLPMEAPYYQTVIGYVEPALTAVPDMELIRREVCDAAKSCGYPVGLLYNARGIILIISFSSADDAVRLEPALDEAGYGIKVRHRISFRFVYGKLCTASYQIPKSFQEAREAMKLRLFSVGEPAGGREETFENGQTLFPLKERQRLLNAVYARNSQLVEQYLDRLHQEYKKSQTLYPAGYIHKLSSELIMLLSLILYERNETANSLAPEYSGILNKIRKHSHPDDIFPPIKALYKRLVDYLPEAVDKKNRQAIRLCLDYIESNLHTEIRLEDIAQMVFLTPNYLGTLFKEAVGTGFSEYVTQQRMERAKKLLLVPGSRVYEVSQQVGYKNAHYFSKLFKEYTGVKPSQFK